MDKSETIKSIAPAIVKAQSECKAIAKSGENKFDKYKYADLEDYVSASRPILSANGLSVVFSADEVTALEDRTTKNGGKEHAVRVKATITMLHTSGEWVTVKTQGEGQDRADKAIYKAITGARKYGIAQILDLSTSDDPERDEAVGQAEAPRKPKVDPDKAFRVALAKAFTTRNFTVDEQKATVDDVVEGYQLKTLLDMTSEQRHLFVDAVKAGEMDHYKAVQEGQAQ